MTTDPPRWPPHKRELWGVEPDPQPVGRDHLQSPDETRREAKRLLSRDAAIILIGIVVALLVVQFLPGIAPGLVADQSSSAPGAGSGVTAAPNGSAASGSTLGPVVDPSLDIRRTRPPEPALTLPPTGTFDPGETATPTPRPSKKPPATAAPPTPRPTPEPTPDHTPAPTEPPVTQPPPTDEPPATDDPTTGP